MSSFASAQCKLLLERLSGSFNSSSRLVDIEMLKRLEDLLLTLSAVVYDAEEKGAINDSVKMWVVELKHAVYDAEDILDEIAFEAKSEPSPAARTTRKFIPSFLKVHNTNKKISSKLNSVIARLEFLCERKDRYNFVEVSRSRGSEITTSIRLPTTSLVNEIDVYGREDDVQRILKMLLSDDYASGSEVSVLSIVGMGGSGKTTLAQLVYNCLEVRKTFDLRIWVSVSDDFDVYRVTKVILASATRLATEIQGLDLDLLQSKLYDALLGKRFLLVLDDVWNEDFNKWSFLRRPFTAGIKGSKIMVTTRSNSVAKVMSTLPAFYMDLLSDDKCWQLFHKYAFGFDGQVSNPDLEAIGKKIVKKCRGLPLAAKTLGSLLRSKQTAREWLDVLHSDVWETSDEYGILPILRISYDHLPDQLKQCFAYCSLFPKDYLFQKDHLVRLWMAEGFLPQSRGRPMEEVGDNFFNDLVLRSFFQISSSRSGYVMHDLMHDLALSVSGEFFFKLEYFLEFGEKVRHASCTPMDPAASRGFTALSRAKSLRSFLMFNLHSDNESHSVISKKDLLDVLVKLPVLRVLSLPFCNISVLPQSIGNLKHLRYLDFSDNTSLDMLPEAICSLLNLQTLVLFNCSSLSKLPKDMGRLTDLHHLDISGTNIQEMPLQMSRLQSLHTLTDFIVGNGGSTIRELSGLSNLRGALSISKLQNVGDENDAFNARLKEMKYLNKLKLEWSSNCGVREKDILVIQHLQPPQELKKLRIASYPGKRFPDWIGETLLLNLVSLHLRDCLNCSELPPLGHLPRLETLRVEGFYAVCRVGEEFCWKKSSPNKPFQSLNKPFQSLKTLKFARMIHWQEWVTLYVEADEFPCLNELYIENCPKLVNISTSFPSLKKLEVSMWNESVDLFPLPFTSKHCDVQIDGNRRRPRSKDDDDDDNRRRPRSKVDDDDDDDDAATVISVQSHAPSQSSSSSYAGDHRSIHQSTSIGYYRPSSPVREQLKPAVSHEVQLQHTSPKNLKVSDPTLFGENFPSDLHSLRIEGCGRDNLPNEIISNNPSLQELYIIDCFSLKSFPVGVGSHRFALKTLHIRNCRELEFPLSAEMMQNYAQLEHLSIGSSCDSLRSFPLNFFSKLRILCLSDCLSLESISIDEGLRNKKDLKWLDALEIRDCPSFVSFPKEGLSASNLTSIILSNCMKLPSLPRQMFILLKSLQSLYINKCPELESLPLSGLPSSLNLLCITSCEKIIPRTEWKLDRLDALSHFEIEGGCEKIYSFPEKGLLPSNLMSLRISTLPHLKSLDEEGLQHLTSLETLEITSCKRLRSLPEELPSSLSLLSIRECPLLKAKLQNRKGNDWSKLADKRKIVIDGEESN